jgi:predicted NUDIX family NTP pyrophosphohydrolase
MKKQSAGILLYRKRGAAVEVLVGHAGGPFWGKKDAGAWSIPKGEFEADEEPKAAARREFEEELGIPAPEGELLDLGSIKRKDGKTIYVWALEGDADPEKLTSNTFDLEWPPKSGQIQQFPEFDKAAWLPIHKAGPKLHKGQSEFIDRLAEKLGVDLNAAGKPAASGSSSSPPADQPQTSLF